MKTQVLYSSLGVFVGPAPSNTGHFITSDGTVNNNWNTTTDNNSLVFPLKRVISSSFSIDPQRIQISNLGNFGTIARPILNNAQIKLNVDYYLMGLINEMRVGLLANVNTNGGIGEPLLSESGRFSILSGLYTRDYSTTYDFEYYKWPLKCREPKNLFIAAKKDGLDLNDTTSGTNLSTLYKNTTVDVYGFGDCYLESYRCSAAYNQIPTVSLGFSANNLELYSSGLCCDIPSVIPTTYDIRSGTKFSIPNTFEGTGLPTVLIPRDISLTIKQRSNNSTQLTDLIVDFNDIKIQNFDFSFNLNRSPMYSLGAKIPYDQKITIPIISELNIKTFPGDSKAGSLVSLIKRDEPYDISIRMSYQNKNQFTGVGICYEFIGAKFGGASSSSSIGSRQDFNLKFETQLNPISTSYGLFMTGYLGIPNSPTDIVYLADSFFSNTMPVDNLLMQNGDLFWLNTSGYRILY